MSLITERISSFPRTDQEKLPKPRAATLALLDICRASGPLLVYVLQA
jgi:hypothetical protein